MADRFILSHLRRLPMFARLTPEQYELVASIVQVLRFEPGQFLFRQGQPTPGLIYFVSGGGILVQHINGADRQVGAVSTNQYVNETALLVDTTASVSLQATQVSIVLFIPRPQMAALIAREPALAAALRVPGPVAPAGIQVFRGQRPGETVVLEFRAHWWDWARRLWLPALLAAGLLGAAILSAPAAPELALSLVGLALVAAGLLSFYFFLEWRNDRVIITDQRVIHEHRNILAFRVSVSEIPIAAIHEVNAALPPGDPLAQLLNFGRLVIKTTGETSNMVVDRVPNPTAIQNVIFTHRSRYRDVQTQQKREAIREEIGKFLHGSAPDAGPTQTADARDRSPHLLQMRFTNERGETVYRRHVAVWMRRAVWPALLMLLGGLIFAFDLLRLPLISDLGIVGVAIGVFLVLLGAVWLYLVDWDWRNDMYIVGDQTITIIHKRPLWLQNQTDQVALTQVDNVVSDMRGFFNNLIQMGDVQLLLVGVDARNAKVFRQVYRPQDIQQEISQRRERARQRAQQEDAQRQRQAIVEYLSVYHEALNNQGGAAPGPSAAPAARPPDRTRPPGVPRPRGG